MNDDERTCPECAETIKKAAASCRFCGHRFRGTDPADGPMTDAQKKVAKTSRIGCAVIVVGMIAMVSFCTPDDNASTGEGGSDQAAQSATEDGANEAPDRSTQHNIVIMSRDGVRARLRDPDSAEFRNVGYYSGGPEGAAVCGEVNAKNGFGGFTGFERFVAMGPETAFLESEVATSEFATVWDTLCVKAETDEVQIP